MLASLLAACSQGEEDVSFQTRDCALTVHYDAGDARPEAISLVGDFNFWDPVRHPMDDLGDGWFRARIELEPGTVQYRIHIDGSSELDAYNPLTLFDPVGRENSAFHVPDCSRGDWEVERQAIEADGALELDLAFLRARSGAALDAGSVEVELDGVAWTDAVLTPVAGSERLQLRGRLASGKHRLIVRARDREGAEVDELVLPLWSEPEPFDWRDALVYQVLVDRFRRGGGALDDAACISDFHGGDLFGVLEALEEGYFDSLGVCALWLSPLYDNPEGAFIGRDGHASRAYHGYWPAAPRTVEPRFGGEQALQALVAAAHARGMRVLLDAVPNHVHIEHPLWTEHAGGLWFNFPEGDCICGMSCSWETEIERCWFDPFLPDIRFAHPPAVAQAVDDALWWIETFDLDGLRIDAVPMMPRLVVRHLRAALVDRLGAGGAHVYLLGETYTGRYGQDAIRYYLGPDSLSGQFDFPVLWALRDALAGRIALEELDAELLRSERAWEGSGAVMAPVLGNHDVPRFLSDVNGDPVHLPRERPPGTPDTDKPYQLLAMAWTFLLALPGAPVIYYGDEIGLPGAGDPDNRRNLRFGEELIPREQALLDHVRRLGQARRCSRSLRRGLRRTLLVTENLYVFARYLVDEAEPKTAICALNPATVDRELQVTLPSEADPGTQAAFFDLDGAAVDYDAASRHLSLRVPARGSTLVLSEQACRPEEE
ncbi:MAG: glycosyl hydrolase [Deltaproteobacteria bacterium]|nr:glycosyl hydrolase [Deltaproteobacteria bacterium]